MSARLILVRHGRAAARWDEHLDPGLDDVGRDQARAMADVVAPLGPLALVTSPLRRARETVAVLESRWGATAGVEPALGEIPSPTRDVVERTAWLRSHMRSSWSEMDDDLRGWRDAAVSLLSGLTGDTVVASHYMLINVAVGAATGDDRLVCFGPDNCSRTVLEVQDGGLTVVELGDQAVTTVG